MDEETKAAFSMTLKALSRIAEVSFEALEMSLQACASTAKLNETEFSASLADLSSKRHELAESLREASEGLRKK